MPFGLLGLVWGLIGGHPAAGWVWLLAMAANRWLQAVAILSVLGDPDRARNVAIYPLRDLLGSILWVGSYAGNEFYYRGKMYLMKPGGRVEEADRRPPVFQDPAEGLKR
jgi:ceramide glucosyltransferase